MPFAYATTDRIGRRATLGLIVLSADETLEHDLHRLLPSDGVALLATRIPSAPEVHTDTLKRMEAQLRTAAALLPESLRFDAVGYGCTSGTAVIGAANVARQIQAGCDAAAVTEPVSALIAACRHLGLRRLALLSPYVAPVSATLRETLAEAGIATPVFGSFDEAREHRVARIAPRSIIDAATALAGQGGVDGVFLSCTNLRTLDTIEPIESATGLPVLSSNLVLAWHLARLGAIAPAKRLGRLMR